MFLDVRGNPHAALLFILLFPVLVNPENDWAGMLALIPGIVLVWLLAIFLTFGKNPDTGAATPADQGTFPPPLAGTGGDLACTYEEP